MLADDCGPKESKYKLEAGSIAIFFLMPVFSAPILFKRYGWQTLKNEWLSQRLRLVAIGLLSSYVALGLLRLIGLFTNLFYYQRWSTELVSPAHHHLGGWSVLVPVAGALIIGLMARYGSERIRGHGIPEAIEAILIKAARCSLGWRS